MSETYFIFIASEGHFVITRVLLNYEIARFASFHRDADVLCAYSIFLYCHGCFVVALL